MKGRRSTLIKQTFRESPIFTSFEPNGYLLEVALYVPHAQVWVALLALWEVYLTHLSLLLPLSHSLCFDLAYILVRLRAS
jgi:hypothetical protein